jgi:small subunit ribosomal protein S4
MGSPRRQRKKFSKPSHPWQKERILSEKVFSKDYGLKRKFEIWKMNSILKNFTKQAKSLITKKNPQSEKETSQLLTKLSSLGLLESGAKIEDVLGLTLKDVMERRLQTLVYKKNMARTLTQARQLIVHQHISVGDKKITAPSHLVPLAEESNIQFASGSPFSDSNHPERKIEEKKPKESKKKVEKQDKAKESTDEKKEAKQETKKETKEKKKEEKPKKEASKEKSTKETKNKEKK